MTIKSTPDGRTLDPTGGSDNPERVNKSKKDPSIRGKKALTSQNRNYTNLEQQILMQNIDQAYNYYMSNSELFGYRTFRQINGNSANLVHELRGLPDFTVFRDVKNSILSLLQPKIRIFSMDVEEYVHGSDGRLDGGYFVPLTSPCYREFKFSDNFGYELATSVENYLSYESTRPTFRNVGLKSFSLKWDGRKFGALDTDIMCTLKLSLKSLKDLNASPPGEPHWEKGGLRYLDLITYKGSRTGGQDEAYNPNQNIIKVIMGYESPTEDQLRGLNLSLKERRDLARIARFNLMITLGMVNYQMDLQEDGRVNVTVNYRSRIERSLGGNSVNIFQNNYEVSKEGELVPSARTDIKQNIGKIYAYNTSINKIHKQLLQDNCKDDKCRARVELRTLINKDAFFSNIYNECGGAGVKKNSDLGFEIENESDVYNWMKDKENVKKMFALIKQKVGLFKKNIFKSFTDALIDGNPLEAGGAGTRLFCVKATKSDLKKAMGIVDTTEKTKLEKTEEGRLSEQEIMDATSAAIGRSKSGMKIGRCSDVQEDSVKVKEETAKQLTNISSESDSKDSSTRKQQEKSDDGSKKPIYDFDSENYKFYFLYLGDIIELACRNAGIKALDFTADFLSDRDTPYVFDKTGYLKGDAETELGYALTSMRFLIGPIEYYNSRGKLRQINLAQFPVSFNFFRAWFMKNIVHKRNSQMPLRDFIIKLINEVVLVGMGKDMADPVRPSRARFVAEVLTLPGKQSPDQQFRAFGRTSTRPKELLPIVPQLDIHSPNFRMNYRDKVRKITSMESMIHTSYDYVLLYISSAINDVTRREGNPVEDLRDGIFHFNIGSDYGMLKNMDFKKVNMPFRTEQMFEEALADGREAAQQLKFPYSTDVTLIGTPIFSPGMFYYVNPSMLGLGSIEDRNSIAHQLNLGGYHLILSVELDISQSGYETRITGKQQGHGIR